MDNYVLLTDWLLKEGKKTLPQIQIFLGLKDRNDTKRFIDTATSKIPIYENDFVKKTRYGIYKQW